MSKFEGAWFEFYTLVVVSHVSQETSWIQLTPGRSYREPIGQLARNETPDKCTHLCQTRIRNLQVKLARRKSSLTASLAYRCELCDPPRQS